MGKKGKQFISVLMILALLLGIFPTNVVWACLLYTSDAADE